MQHELALPRRPRLLHARYAASTQARNRATTPPYAHTWAATADADVHRRTHRGAATARSGHLATASSRMEMAPAQSPSHSAIAARCAARRSPSATPLPGNAASLTAAATGFTHRHSRHTETCRDTPTTEPNRDNRQCRHTHTQQQPLAGSRETQKRGHLRCWGPAQPLPAAASCWPPRQLELRSHAHARTARLHSDVGSDEAHGTA